MAAFDAGPRKPWARMTLRGLFVLVAGLYLFRFGLPGLVLGGAYIAGGAALTPQLDSETRFLSAVALGVGVGTVWLIRHFEEAPKAAALLASFSGIGGLARIASMVLVGVPDTIALVATGLEILLPTVTLYLLTQRA